jgi:hypothetical protein
VNATLSYQDFIRILLPASTTRFLSTLKDIPDFKYHVQIVLELSGIYCHVSGQAREIIPESGAIKQLAGFFKKNVITLVKLAHCTQCKP